ncbi:MAG: FGGY family carbohydrate kinase [Flavonifractor plautii]
MESNIPASAIAAIGITNQRETTIVWDRKTGRPIYNAIVWQCRAHRDLVRTSCWPTAARNIFGRPPVCVPDAYFSATKIKWMLDHIPEAPGSAPGTGNCSSARWIPG